MPARKVVSDQQLQRLLDAMEADRGFASGRPALEHRPTRKAAGPRQVGAAGDPA